MAGADARSRPRSDPGSLGIGLFIVAIVPVVADACASRRRSTSSELARSGVAGADHRVRAVQPVRRRRARRRWAYIGLDWVAGLALVHGQDLRLRVHCSSGCAARCPRVRIDQLMGFAWKWLLPAALLNLFVTAAAIVVVETREDRPDELRPRPRHRPRAWRLTLRRFFEPKVTVRTPRCRRTSRPSSAAASSCSTTSTARSSARPASSAPRPARSSASTWAAWTPRVASTSTGARRRRTASGARNRALRRSGRTGPGSGLSTASRPIDLGRGRRRSSRRYDHDPAHLLAILEATQAAYGYLPVGALKRISQVTGAWYADDLRHGHATTRHLRFEPPTRRPRRQPRWPTDDPRRPPTLRARRRARPDGAGRRRMTDATMLKTPDGLAVASSLPRAAGRRIPTDLDAAVAAGAFDGLRRAIRDLGATGTIATIGASGLRGRGGAGYPGGRQVACRQRHRRRPAAYVVANGYGADPASDDRPHPPGTRTRSRSSRAWPSPRSRSAPTRGDHRGPRRRPTAIADARGARSPRPRTPGSSATTCSGRATDVDASGPPGPGRIHARRGDGPAQGPRGQARPAGAATAPSGRRAACAAMPTVVHNVQTLAAVPWIVRQRRRRVRARSARRTAPARSSSRSAAPAGAGIAEVPLGTPLRDDRRTSAGALPAARPLKAVLVGGPSGGILPPDALDTPYTFEALRDAGAHVGSGSVVVADDRACIVDLARLLTRFCADEACGKTIPCRIGTAAPVRDRRSRSRTGSAPTDPTLLADLAADIVGQRPVRPRAPGDAPAHQRDAILPSRSSTTTSLRSTCPAGVCHPIAVTAGATH